MAVQVAQARRLDALEHLGAALGLAPLAGRVTIEGSDPVVSSPHRLGLATATALAAQGLAAAELWHGRGGGAQQVSVDVRDGVAALDTNRFMRLNGHSIERRRVLPREPLNGIYPTGDGRWVVFQATYPHHRNGLLARLGAANSAEAVTAATKRWRAEELEEACAAADLPCAMVRSRDEWLAHPQGRLLVGRPVVSIEKIAAGDPAPMADAARPLAGLRVVDATHVIAGPGLSRTLAEHGADVLHVTAPHLMDPWVIALDTGMGKRSCFLDIDAPPNLDRLKSLIGHADVFVQSYAPGSLARRGLSPAEVARLRPGIVYISICCYGDEGPWAGRGGFDPQAQAVAGIMAAEGGAGAPRTPPTQLLNDYLTAYLGAAGAIAALSRRAREGGSYHVSLSLARTAMWVQEFGLLAPEAVAEAPASLDTAGFATARIETPFGTLDHLPPVTRMARTPARWEHPPCPQGSSAPVWRGMDEGSGPSA